MTLATPPFEHFLFFCVVRPTINVHAKLKVSSFSRSRDIRGSHNLKRRSRDPGYVTRYGFYLPPDEMLGKNFFRTVKHYAMRHESVDAL